MFEVPVAARERSADDSTARLAAGKVRRRSSASITPTRPPPIGPEGGPVDPTVAARIGESRGRPLPVVVRDPMEQAFGVDLSAVRIHESEAASDLSAVAFTQGTNVHFAPGRFRPQTASGQELLAHELSHVIQQSGSRIRRAMMVGAAEDPAEREADRMAGRVMGRIRAARVHDGGQALAAMPAVDDGVLRRRLNLATLTNAFQATNTKNDGIRVWRGQVVAPMKRVLDKEPPGPIRTGYQNAVTPNVTAVTNAFSIAPYNVANLAVPLALVVNQLNGIEEEINLRRAGVGANALTMANQGDAQGLLATTQARQDLVHEAVATLGTPARAAALAQARQAATIAANAGPYNAGAARAALGDYAGLLDDEEQATAPRNLLKVGTEFTFTNDNINELDIRNGGDHLNEATRLIDLWRDKVLVKDLYAGDSTDPLATPTESDHDLNWKGVRAGSANPDRAEQRRRRFTYALPSGGTWWWQLDVDYQCIETQTDPATRAMMTAGTSADADVISTIIQGHIFDIGLSGSLGLQTHATIGGGHITLDRRTAFGDNARWLRNYLVLYANDVNGAWSGQDLDVFNAPMIKDLKAGGKAAFKAVIREFDQGVIRTADSLANAMVLRVFKADFLPDPQTADQRAANESRIRQPAHYQSTNLEKWADDGGTGTGTRLEMRRFDAQASLNDLLANLDAIGRLLTASRQVGNVELRIG
jgi:hypothetical protein